MYATSLPPRRNPLARVLDNYAPRFSPDEFPPIPVSFNPSWRTPPSKIWGDEEITRPCNTYPARPHTMPGLTRYTRDSSARKTWNSFRENSTGRLHSVQTHNLSDRSIDSGLIPPHLLDGSLPPTTKPISSIDFFPPCKKPATAPPIRMGHQFRLLRKPTTDQMAAFKRGFILQDGPIRIVRHTSTDHTYTKENRHRKPRGNARNVLGGFCTS